MAPLLTLVSLMLFISQSFTTIPVFLVHPVFINTTEGSVVQFTCVANNSDSILYFVNDDPATDESVIDKGFALVTGELEGGLRRATLTVTANSSSNNNSMIKCRAVGSSMNTDSDEVILRVQGQLSSVVDLSYSFIDSSTITISWSPPFTLPGTDITGYNISATSNGTTTNYFTSNSYYLLSLTDITDSPCEVITISVSGYNGLDGESTTVRAPSSMIDLPVILLIENYFLFIVINDTQFCPESGGKDINVLPELINITLSSNNSVINQTSIDSQLILLHDDDNSTDDDGFNGFQVQSDLTYTVTISFELFNGSYSYMDSIDIDTYDLVSANVTSVSDSTVCIECVFSPFSPDTSCILELVSSTNTIQRLILSRTPSDSDVARDCFDSEIIGIFTLHVLEQNSTIRRFNIGTVTLIPTTTTISSSSLTPYSSNTDTTSTITKSITNVIPSSTTTISLPTSSSPPSNSLPVLLIAGIVVGLVLVILIVIVLAILVCMILYHRKRKHNSFDVTKQQSNGRSSKSEDLYCSPSHFVKPISSSSTVETYIDPIDIIPTSVPPPVPKRNSSSNINNRPSLAEALPPKDSDIPVTFSQLPIYSEPFIKQQQVSPPSTILSHTSTISALLPDVIETANTNSAKPRPYERVVISKRSTPSNGEDLQVNDNHNFIYESIKEQQHQR